VSYSSRAAADLKTKLAEKWSNVHSWKLCYDYFGSVDDCFDADEAALRLAYYLASWGMYRGSSKTRNLFYTAFVEVVCYLRSGEVADLRNVSIRDSIASSSDIIGLVQKIREKLPKGELVSSETDTLITKIMLGAHAIMPAYDRYFIDGARIIGARRAVSPMYFKDLVEKADENVEFSKFRARVAIYNISDMRLLDYYLNFIGHSHK